MNEINKYEAYSHSEVNSSIEYAPTTKQEMWKKTFGWMMLALFTSAVTAYLGLTTTTFNFLMSSGAYWILLIAELILVFTISGAINKISSTVAFALFMVYSALNGITMAMILQIYTQASVVGAFAVTAGMFGVMALIGYVTKIDLSKMGSILMMALIGLIIASVVNIFLHSSMMYWIITYVGVLLFCGLTAWDIQKFKRLYAEGEFDQESGSKLAIIAALNLYLDFINLFLFILRILGSRNS